MAIWTRTDLFDYINAVTPSAGPRNTAIAQSVVRDTMAGLHRLHDWPYYKREFTFRTQAKYATGTIEYDHTGGSSERLLTITGGTFPSWSPLAIISISESRYRIARYLSSTTVQLEVNENPGQDVAAGTAFAMYVHEYPLPADAGDVISVHSGTRPLTSGTPYLESDYGAQWYEPGDPLRFHVVGRVSSYGSKFLRLIPAPSEAKIIRVSYKAAGRPFRLAAAYSTGTVTVTAGSRSVTGSGTTFPLRCEGAVIRFSVSATAPTSDEGSNPAVFTGVIARRISATSIELLEPAPEAATAVAYVIDDPLDIDETSMLAFIRADVHYQFTVRCNTSMESVSMLASIRRSALSYARTETSGVHGGFSSPYDIYAALSEVGED